MKYFKSKTSILFFLILILSITLRFYRLGSLPPSLYSDEINQGYNAYSILSTGKDEHGTFLPIALRSFGDWKPPLPTYMMIPSIGWFGLTEEAVRIPSAICGVLSVILTYLLVLEIITLLSARKKIALLSAFFITISPWHILQSRAAMLVIVSLLFIQLGVWLFIRGIKRQQLTFLLSAICFGLSFYAYYAMRVITPAIILLLVILYRNALFRSKKRVFSFLSMIVIVLLPLFLSFLHEPDVVFGRAKTVSVFFDRGVKLRQWELMTQDGIEGSTLITRFFHNNVYLFSRNILQRYFSHFDPYYLIAKGDTAYPFGIPGMGILYVADIFFLFSGIYFYIKKKQSILLLGWILISIIPAALTFLTPSSNRTFTAIFGYMILISYGVWIFTKIISVRILPIIILLLVYISNFWFFMRAYYLLMPKDYAQWWNYGWKDVVNFVKENEPKYDNIVISDANGMPYIYFLFYNSYNPSDFQKNAVKTYVADKFGFEHVEGFDKYIFRNDVTWGQLKDERLPKSLYVVPADQAKDETDYIYASYFPDGKAAFKVFMTK